MVKDYSKRKLPVRQLTILAICRFAEPISLTSIFPYLPEMIESFHVPESDVAFWAGAVSAIYSLSQCLTAIAWGTASDRYGRKYVIMLGLINTMATSLLWGFSTSLPMAMAARALSGAGNGNVGIIRTMVAEMVPYRELQPRAFSVMPLVYNVGSVLGPALGGALSNPLNRKPVDDPRGGSLLWRYPYALPNIVAACFFLFGITVGTLFLHETLAAKKADRDYGRVLGKKLVASVKHGIRDLKKSVRSLRGTAAEEEPLLRSDLSSSYNTLKDEETASAELDPVEPANKPTYREVMTKQTALNLLVYTLLAMHSIAFDQILPVFLHHPRSGSDIFPYQFPLRFNQGFGLQTARIGLMFTIYGMFGIFWQFVLFPPVAQKYGVLNCLRAVLTIMPIVYIIAPFATLVPSVLGAQLTLFGLWLIKGICATFAFPCSTIMLTNSASSLTVLGTVNGIATSFSAIGRAAGPTLAGATFTWGVKEGYIITPFWTLACVGALTIVPVWYLEDGKGFGDDESEEGDTEGEAEEIDTEDEQEGNGQKRPSSIKPSRVRRDDMGLSSEDQDAVAPLGGLLNRESNLSRTVSRTSTRGRPSHAQRSRSVASSSGYMTDSDVGYEEEAEDEDPWPAEWDPRNHETLSSSVPASEAQQERSRPRRRRNSSVPIGMGLGFRRISSNLGQTRSGFGTGAGIGEV